MNRDEADPYRGVSAPCTLAGALIERRVGPLRLFVNRENLTDVRQQRWDPVLRPARARRPLDGRRLGAPGWTYSQRRGPGAVLRKRESR